MTLSNRPAIRLPLPSHLLEPIRTPTLIHCRCRLHSLSQRCRFNWSDLYDNRNNSNMTVTSHTGQSRMLTTVQRSTLRTTRATRHTVHKVRIFVLETRLTIRSTRLTVQSVRPTIRETRLTTRNIRLTAHPVRQTIREIRLATHSTRGSVQSVQPTVQIVRLSVQW